MAETVLKITLEGAQQAENGIEGVAKAYGEVGNAAKKSGEESKKVFKETTQNGDILNNSLKNLKSNIIGAFAGVATIGAISSFAKDSIKAFAEAEVNANKLKFAIKSIGGESDQAFDKLIEQSSKLQDISIFSDDDIQKAQTALSQYGLVSDEIEKLTPLIVDLASAQGIDLASATDKVISGINGQTRALKDAGVSFEDTGDKTSNLSILMGQLDKFTGAAAVSLDTAAGRAANFKNRIGDIQETVGSFLVDAGNAFLEFLDNITDPVGNAADKGIAKAAKEIKLRNDTILRDLNEFNKAQLEQRIKLDQDVLKQVIKGNIKLTEEGKRFLLAEIEVAEKLIKQKNQLEENLRLAGAKKASEDAAKAAKKRSEEDAANELRISKDRTARAQKENDENDKRFEDEQKDALKLEEDFQKLVKQQKKKDFDEQIDELKEQNEKELKLKQEVEDEKKRIKEATNSQLLNLEKEAFDFINQLGRQETDEKLNNLNQQLNDKKITDEQFKAQRKAILTEQFEKDKAAKIIETLINTAVAVSKVSPNPALIALAIAIGALQTASIEAQPTPQFYKGGYTGDGGKYEYAGDVHKGEFVADKETTSKHRGLLEAIQGNKNPSIADITGLLKGTGVVLIPETANRISGELTASGNQKLYQQQESEKTLKEINNNLKKYFSEQGKNIDKTLADGTRVIKNGNTTRVIRKRRI